MDRLERYRVFVQIAQTGSFTRAAHALGLPRATVSDAVRQLEADLGTRLLHRTTRSVRATSDGLQLLERVRGLLAEAGDIEQLFLTRRRQVAGRLSVDAPSRMARRLITPALPGLLYRHPQLQLALGSRDRHVDLVREGVDCAIRVGELSDSSLVAHPVGQVGLVNCASPSYLAEHGTPADVDDLADGHWSVGYAASGSGRALPWEYLDADGELHTRALQARVIVDNAESYIACCRAGLGLIQVPRYDVQPMIDRGELIEVLPQAQAAPMAVSMLYPHRRQRSQRLTAFVEWFQTLIAPHLESSTTWRPPSR